MKWGCGAVGLWGSLRRGARSVAAASLVFAAPRPHSPTAHQNPQETFRRFESNTEQSRPSRSDSAGRLMVPGVVQNRARTTARDDDSLVQALEHRLRCTCGCNLDVFTCRTTDFTCATSPAMHRLVLARLDSNLTPAQVIAAFEAQYGQQIFMQPPKRGFNWTAYVMPFVALAVGLFIVGLFMRHWIRAKPKDRPTVPQPDSPTADEDLERLKRELEKFEA